MFKSLMSAMVIAGALVLPGKAFADGPGTAYLNGAEIYEMCISNDPKDAIFCEAYITAVADGSIMMKTPKGVQICVPKNTPVRALIRQVTYFLSDRPDAAEIPGAAAVFFSLHRKYLCS